MRTPVPYDPIYDTGYRSKQDKKNAQRRGRNVQSTDTENKQQRRHTRERNRVLRTAGARRG